jgi:hypothetical protein
MMTFFPTENPSAGIMALGFLGKSFNYVLEI